MQIFSLIACFPGKVRRKTSNGQFLPRIDGLRFLAIAIVLAVHIIAYTIGKSTAPMRASWFGDAYEHLARGVQLFFVTLVAAYSLPTSALWTNAAIASLFGIAVTAAFRGTSLAPWMSIPWLTAIGGMCYPIYPIHIPLIYLFGYVATRAMILPNRALNALLGLLILPLSVLVFRSLFFLAVEKPCMNKQWPRDLVRFVFPAGRDNVTPLPASL